MLADAVGETVVEVILVGVGVIPMMMVGGIVVVEVMLVGVGMVVMVVGIVGVLGTGTEV